MADIDDLNVFSNTFRSISNFSTSKTPDGKSLLDTFRASPRLVDDLNKFRRDMGGQITLGPAGKGPRYIPGNGTTPPQIQIDPQEPFSAPNHIAGLIAHELGHALR